MSSRSVKLLDECEEDDGEDTRETWWQEIRQEVRNHARSLSCNVIVGYAEDIVISEDCVVMCASGTAASCDLAHVLDLDANGAIFGPPFQNTGPAAKEKARAAAAVPLANSAEENPAYEDCSYLHVPYVDYSLPYSCKLSRCVTCGKGRVPDVIFCTIEPPVGFQVVGRGCLLQAKVLRLKKDLKAADQQDEGERHERRVRPQVQDLDRGQDHRGDGDRHGLLPRLPARPVETQAHLLVLCHRPGSDRTGPTPEEAGRPDCRERGVLRPIQEQQYQVFEGEQ